MTYLFSCIKLWFECVGVCLLYEREFIVWTRSKLGNSIKELQKCQVHSFSYVSSCIKLLKFWKWEARVLYQYIQTLKEMRCSLNPRISVLLSVIVFLKFLNQKFILNLLWKRLKFGNIGNSILWYKMLMFPVHKITFLKEDGFFRGSRHLI